MKALDHIEKVEGRALFILRDFHAFVDNPQVVRKLRDLGHALKKTQKSVLLLSPVMKLPPELEKEVAVIDWDLPDRGELDELGQACCIAQLPPGAEPGIAATPEGRERIVEAALGLTYVEAENVLAKSIVRNKTLRCARPSSAKRSTSSASRGSSSITRRKSRSHEIGGLEILKGWLQKRRNAFTQHARDFGLPLPKGILLIGVPGCGKSLTAKAVGAAWQMPLLRLDVGKIFGGLVGASEENIRKAHQDGRGGRRRRSSGSTRWRRASPARRRRARPTAAPPRACSAPSSPGCRRRRRRCSSSPPPTTCTSCRRSSCARAASTRSSSSICRRAKSARSIFDIHLKKKKRDPAELGIDLGKLVDAAPEFSGAEIEQAVISALYDAFDGGSNLSTDGLLTSLREIVPLAVTMQEGIASMREWAKTRARLASPTQDKPKDQFAAIERKLEV